MALKNQGIEHEVVAIAEVDEYALLSYHAIHTADIEVKEASEEEMQIYMEKKNIPLDPKGKRKILKNKRLKDLYVASVASNNLGDISKITDDKIPQVDLFTYSFPCQDISLAGKQKGLDKNSGTRSSLLWECEKIIETVKPKYLLMENVKALVNKNNKPQFDIWLEYLEELGYKNFWEILNAKDYGIPQNRERVFVVSILDENIDYKFPNKTPLTLKLKDILEDNVDESYYLSQEQVDKITFSARDFKDPKCVKVEQLGQYNTPKRQNSNIYRVYDKEGLAPTLNTMQGGWRQPSVMIKNANKKGVVLKPKEEFGRMGKQAIETFNQNECNYGDTINPFNKTLDSSGNCPTLTTRPEGFKTAILPITEDFRIRKLTPLECWRLMGVADEDFKKASKVVSNSQLYKQAGNAIVVDVLEGIFKQLFNTVNENKTTEDKQ